MMFFTIELLIHIKINQSFKISKNVFSIRLNLLSLNINISSINNLLKNLERRINESKRDLRPEVRFVYITILYTFYITYI